MEPQYLQVARHLRNAITAGKYRHGDRLPSTRELAQEWDVSVFTINEAMGVLSKEGLIVSRPRTGRVVNYPEQEPPSPTQKTAKPQVVFIGGYAGSGKTELGRMIARATKWAMLDKDTITRPVVEAALSTLGLSINDRESHSYLNVIRPREYEALEASIVENLECGNSVVATAPFLREFSDDAWLSRARARVESFDGAMTVVWVYCDPETMHFYLRARGAARDSSKLANWDEYLSNIDTSFRPNTPHYVIDNSNSNTPLQIQAGKLISDISAKGRGGDE
uniref:GntR family transcriptional regulator n=1 Tax=Amycolatopsis sp. CA-082387 TaxID=3239918 RepID=UPI003F4944CB